MERRQRTLARSISQSAVQIYQDPGATQSRSRGIKAEPVTRNSDPQRDRFGHEGGIHLSAVDDPQPLAVDGAPEVVGRPVPVWVATVHAVSMASRAAHGTPRLSAPTATKWIPPWPRSSRPTTEAARYRYRRQAITRSHPTMRSPAPVPARGLSVSGLERGGPSNPTGQASHLSQRRLPQPSHRHETPPTTAAPHPSAACTPGTSASLPGRRGPSTP